MQLLRILIPSLSLYLLSQKHLQLRVHRMFCCSMQLVTFQITTKRNNDILLRSSRDLFHVLFINSRIGNFRYPPTEDAKNGWSLISEVCGATPAPKINVATSECGSAWKTKCVRHRYDAFILNLRADRSPVKRIDDSIAKLTEGTWRAKAETKLPHSTYEYVSVWFRFST